MALESVIRYIFDEKFLYQLTATLTIYYVIKVVMFFRLRQRRYNLLKSYGIPGPEPSLLGGHFGMYKSDKRMFEIDTKLRDKYGPVYSVFFGDFPSIVVTDIEIIRKVFLENHKSFGERSPALLDLPLSFGLLFAKRPRWKEVRKKLSPHFQKLSRRGTSSTEFLEDTVKLMLKYIDSKFVASETGKVQLDILALFKSTTLHVISDMAIQLPDVQICEDEPNVKSMDNYINTSDKKTLSLALMFPIVMSAINCLIRWDLLEYSSVMKRVRIEIDKRIEKIIARINRLGPNSTGGGEQKIIDVMAAMLNAGEMSHIELMGNAETILMAGYDTTSTTLAYFFWALGKHTDIQDKLRGELMAHGVDSIYLTQVINETMRMYPIVISFTTRMATETVTVDGLTVPEGTRMVYNNWLMFRDPKLWPNPEKFDPERFKEGTSIDPCAFAPFGLGERKCLGMQLAQLEMRIIVCDVLLRYRVKLVSPSEIDMVSCALSLSKPGKTIIIELERAV